MNDTELIGLLQSSPQRGMAALIKRYSGYVYKIVYTKLCGLYTEQDMEEAVSDIFLKFYRSGVKDGFQIRSLRGLLSLIAERHCIDVLRLKRAETDTVSFDEIGDTISVEEKPVPDTELYDALKELGEPDTTIFIRKYFFGQRSSDIAREMKMKVNTVDKRISRGLVRLRKMLEEGK
jgi:RNA polymerase sigma-70 factor (ECF subfamily)